MTDHDRNYHRIATAIDYIKENYRNQPDLTELAATVNLSPYHFQRIFTDWAGVSPKKFTQYLTIEFAKHMLREYGSNLVETAHETGLSSTSRLHDMFVRIEGMTPGEYKNGGHELEIDYSFASTLFGNIIIASTNRGICHISFESDRKKAISSLKSCFPNAVYRQGANKLHQDALYIFNNEWKPTVRERKKILLHLNATPFQLKVWQALLSVPAGDLATYGMIARQIEHPGAARAVGTAIGCNPVALLIPCHRVIQSSGNTGSYKWGGTRKAAIIGWEAAQREK